ncbi:unnamed protein product [Prorocentrum cordatum]|uniref:Carbohydrate-binding module family 96 domain-containing protein n=1 Tax=Prorocentrum cordatum TaxID=2364126 RepID=A0ABN9PF37_9DINO|nr:unnamed protein product [Polarella glacialis]
MSMLVKLATAFLVVSGANGKDFDSCLMQLAASPTQATTVERPLADTYAQSCQSTNYGTQQVLVTKRYSDGWCGTRYSFLQFSVPCDAQDATLLLWPTDYAAGTFPKVAVFTVQNAWSESTTIWSNHPGWQEQVCDYQAYPGPVGQAFACTVPQAKLAGKNTISFALVAEWMWAGGAVVLGLAKPSTRAPDRRWCSSVLLQHPRRPRRAARPRPRRPVRRAARQAARPPVRPRPRRPVRRAARPPVRPRPRRPARRLRRLRPRRAARPPVRPRPQRPVRRAARPPVRPRPRRPVRRLRRLRVLILMAPGNHVLINIPRGERAEKALLRVQADARRLGKQCTDLYFQDLNVTGSWAEAEQVGGFHYSASQSEVEAPKWVILGKIELKVVRGHTDGRTSYLNVYVKHLGRAGFAVGGLLGEDDHSDASTPEAGCVELVDLQDLQTFRTGSGSRPVSTAEATYA